MYSDLESDQRKREEVISSLYWSLMQNWDIPKPICDHYGFTEDYQLFRQLEELAPLMNTSGKEKPVKFLIFWKWMQG